MSAEAAAARLAGIAQSGQILVSSATKERVWGQYFIESVGTQKLKNIAEEIEAFQLVGRV